jgi:hypothetical protein
MRVLDLSLDGMRIQTTSWMAVGRSYAFRLGDSRQPILGTIVRCAIRQVAGPLDAADQTLYEAGVRFDLGQPAALALLRRWLRSADSAADPTADDVAV